MILSGINLNFAPFLDLHAYWPKRRFSTDPKKIALYAGAFMRGMLRAKVGACGKHFPDGGDRTAGDPHKQAVRVNYTMDQLKIKERYGPLIKQGLPAIMMSHVIFTKIDPNPAVLSRKWIKYLRKDLGFKGVIISDAMEMKAIRNPQAATINAFNAGVDLILADPKVVRPALIKGVMRGRISPQRIQESVTRILAFQKQYPIVISKLTPSQRAKREAILLRQLANLHQRVQSALRRNGN